MLAATSPHRPQHLQSNHLYLSLARLVLHTRGLSVLEPAMLVNHVGECSGGRLITAY